ncbi:hypothetical protein [Nitrosomonas sp. sh817]|uniref:hypothetical protein n=1 Tax=Nitrosomonas sp. sh817 TaxID=3070658 RepID=UPI0027DB915F|nr:hypothetical protein [Nitrosomonas sp. sh817]WMJ07893.1 hypothetical protein RBH92_10715 [Nitrosomonas sp. sh817]
METKELIKAPQLFVVYAIAILYTVVFSLAAVVAPSTDNAVWGLQGIIQVTELGTNSPSHSQAEWDNSSS